MKATSYGQASVLNKEQILDKIVIAAPHKYPMFAGFPKINATALNVESGVEEYEDPDFDGVIDGEDESDFKDPTTGRERFGNRIQTFKKAFQIGRLQQKIATAGASDEFAKASAKKAIELCLSIEAATGSDNEAVVGTSTVKALMRGLGACTDPTNTNMPSVGRTSSDAVIDATSFTETQFAGMAQAAADASGHEGAWDFFCGSDSKTRVTDFSRTEGSTTATPYQIHQMASEKTITRSVLHFDSDWGPIHLTVNRFLGRVSKGGYTDQSKQRGYLIPRNGCVKYAVVTEPTFEELPENGGGRRGRHIADLTLVVENARYLGKAA